MKLVTQYNITSFKVKTQSAPTKSLAQILRNFVRLKNLGERISKSQPTRILQLSLSQEAAQV